MSPRANAPAARTGSSFGWKLVGRTASLLLVLVLSASLGSSTASSQEVDVTGTWNLEVQTSQGGGSPTVTLQQEDGRLTGRYESDLLGTADVSGTVDGSAVTFSMEVSAQGTSLTVTYSGRAEGDTMSGDFDLGGMASGTFTGTRQ